MGGYDLSLMGSHGAVCMSICRSVGRSVGRVTDALSTMLQLLEEESGAASWLMEARSRMEAVEPCDEEW